MFSKYQNKEIPVICLVKSIHFEQNILNVNDADCAFHIRPQTIERFSRAGPRGRGREWATLRVHPLSWLLSNNRLEEVCGTLTTGTFSSRLLLSNQDKGCTPSVAHSLPLPLGPALLNLWTILLYWHNMLNYK